MHKPLLAVLILVVCINENVVRASGLDNAGVEIRSAGFFPTSGKFQKIYGKVSACYEFQATLESENFEGWVNVDWLTKKGRSIGLCDPTCVSIANTSFGINYLLHCTQRVTPYLGIGPSISYIWLHNNSCCSERVSQLAYGVAVKSGFNFCVCKGLFLDLFVDYVYQPVNFQTKSNIGGFKLGLGLGYKF